MAAPLASVGTAALDPVKLAFPFALRARRVVAVADLEDFVQTGVIVREVLAELIDGVSRLCHTHSIRDGYLVVKG